ncbi:MAG: hypothetical protein ACKOW9_01940 [Candidatus Paceibacterota bacterium]
MSVTFEPADTGRLQYNKVGFWCDKEEEMLEPGESHLKELLRLHECQECQAYGGPLVIPVYEAPYLNMANTNAYEIIQLLGYQPVEFVGSTSADDLLGRVLTALAIEPEDEGRPTLREGNFIFCGTEPGYKQRQLTKLRDIAEWAKLRNTPINWG